MRSQSSQWDGNTLPLLGSCLLVPGHGARLPVHTAVPTHLGLALPHPCASPVPDFLCQCTSVLTCSIPSPPLNPPSSANAPPLILNPPISRPPPLPMILGLHTSLCCCAWIVPTPNGALVAVNVIFIHWFLSLPTETAPQGVLPCARLIFDTSGS